MSLFLSCEEMWDRSLGGTGKRKEIPHWFANLAYAVVGLFCKVCFRYKVTGRENLRAFKDKCGVFVVSNHTSFFDVVFIYLTIRPSQFIRLMGRDTLFDNAGGLLGQILTRVGGFPVKRDEADREALRRAVWMLKENEVVGTFPEGTRRNKGAMEPRLHAGAAFIARMAEVPILPMTVRNAEYIKEKGHFMRFPRVTVEFGKPISLADFDFLDRKDQMDAATWYAMRECFALSEEVPREEVNMPELFPHDRDFTEVFAAHPIPEHTTEELVAKHLKDLKDAEEIKEKRKRAKKSKD